MEINSPPKTLELKKQHIATKASTNEELWKINHIKARTNELENISS